MKYYCNSTISWGEHNTGDHVIIPTPLPRVEKEWTEEVHQFILLIIRFLLNIVII